MSCSQHALGTVQHAIVDQGTNPTQRMVLLAMDNALNRYGHSVPSFRWIATYCASTPATIKSTLCALVEAGILTFDSKAHTKIAYQFSGAAPLKQTESVAKPKKKMDPWVFEAQAIWQPIGMFPALKMRSCLRNVVTGHGAEATLAGLRCYVERHTGGGFAHPSDYATHCNEYMPGRAAEESASYADLEV